MNNSRKIRVAIAGGTGYTGGELFRILLNHPEAAAVTTADTTKHPSRHPVLRSRVFFLYNVLKIWYAI